ARRDELRQHDDVRARVDRLADGAEAHGAVRLEIAEPRCELPADDARHGSDGPAAGSWVERRRPLVTRSASPGEKATMASPMSRYAPTMYGKRSYGNATPKTFL